MTEKVSTSQKRIAEMMKVFNITQSDIVRKTKIPKSTLSNYLSGKRTPDQEHLSLLSDPYGVNPAWLMGYDVPMELNPTTIDYESRDIEQALRLYEYYKRSIPQVQSAVDALLKPTQSDS